MKAVGYLRVSSKGQVEGNGFDRQRGAIAARASSLSFDVVKFFEDDITGTLEAAQRPGFQEMLAYCIEREVDTIFVERMDRLGRDAIVSMSILPYLASKGIQLYVSDSGTELTAAIKEDPMMKAIIQIQAVFAELEKNMIVKKLKIARDKKREETGKCEGRKPYGFHEAEKRVVGIIKHLRNDGATINAIAITLNTMGILSRSGKQWGGSTIANIINGEIYASIAPVDPSL